MNELSHCPFCRGDFLIKSVECQQCHTQINGSFHPNRFHSFEAEDLLFIELFLKNEGNIKLMERDLGVSYPTVKSRLKNIIGILGYSPDASKSQTEILGQLSAGKISVDQALKELKEAK